MKYKFGLGKYWKAYMVFSFVIIGVFIAELEHTKYFPITISLIGCMFILVSIIEFLRVRNANRLLEYGIKLSAKIKRIRDLYTKSGVIYFIEAIDEDSNTIYSSHGFSRPPNIKEGDGITVYVDHQNPKRYLVDTRAIQLHSGKKNPDLGVWF